MAIGRGDASIGPSWAPCEVSAELSIVGATSGGSDVGGGASQSRQVWSQARLAARTVLRVIQGGRLIQAARLLRARFFGPRDGCRAKAQLLSGWVLRVNAQPGSVLLWPAAATWSGKSRKLWGSWIAVREVGRRQRLCRVLKGRMSSSVGDARGMTILAGKTEEATGWKTCAGQVLTTVGGCRGMSASSDTTIGRHSISTKTVPVVGLNIERSALCTHVGMCRGGRNSEF